LTEKQVKALDSIQYQLLKKLFRIPFGERVAYEELLIFASHAGYPILPLECRIAKLQLRYLGHVQRMGNERLQKMLVYSSLNIGDNKNNRGAPARNYRQAIRDALNKFGVSLDSWRIGALERNSWRHHLNTLGQEFFMQNWLEKREEKRVIRHMHDDDEVDQMEDDEVWESGLLVQQAEAQHTQAVGLLVRETVVAPSEQQPLPFHYFVDNGYSDNGVVSRVNNDAEEVQLSSQGEQVHVRGDEIVADGGNVVDGEVRPPARRYLVESRHRKASAVLRDKYDKTKSLADDHTALRP
jgi:uncharacterized protein YegJ (DUF2314 family)